MNRILIKNGTLHTMQGHEKAFKGDLLVEGDKIKAIGLNLNDQEAQIIDAAGMHILPGLVDAHSHIGLFDFSGEKGIDDANEMTNPVTAAMDARYGVNPKVKDFQEAYEHGITTMVLIPGSGNVFCGLGVAAKTYGDNIFDMTLKYPCAVKIALGGNPKNTYGGRGALPMTRMGVANVLWDTFKKAKEYLEAKERGESPEYDGNLEGIIPALKGEIPCKIHCTQYDMLTAIEVAKAYGVQFSLEHAWGASDYMDEIIESGCDICYGPIATYRSPGERRKIDIEAVKELDDRGANVALITDSPILSESSLYHHVGEAVREGVDPERALRMVTINAAKTFHADDRIGSLEVGKDADIIIVKGRLGLDTDAKVQTTLINGKVVYTI